METPEPVLEVKNLSVSFNGEEVIKNLSFEVGQGEVMAILGPNGSGKTTLFRALLGVVAYEGEIRLTPRKQDIGYVPQRLTVDPDMPLSAREFLYLKSEGMHNEEDTIMRTGFPRRLLSRRIGSLSGGEFQRLVITWALLGEPKLLLFDEPTAWVDRSAEENMFHLIHTLREEKNLTTLFISHDLNVVYREATSVLCLNGEMICHGHPREVLTPEALEKLYGSKPLFYQHGKHHL